jgi:hypothetical protein
VLLDVTDGAGLVQCLPWFFRAYPMQMFWSLWRVDQHGYGTEYRRGRKADWASLAAIRAVPVPRSWERKE